METSGLYVHVPSYFFHPAGFRGFGFCWAQVVALVAGHLDHRRARKGKHVKSSRRSFLQEKSSGKSVITTSAVSANLTGPGGGGVRWTMSSKIAKQMLSRVDEMVTRAASATQRVKRVDEM